MSEYTPTTEEIVRSFVIPSHVSHPRTEGESFGEYLSRISIEGHASQVESEAAARRWLAAHDAEVRASVVSEEPDWETEYKCRVPGFDWKACTDDPRFCPPGSERRERKVTRWLPVQQEGTEE